MTISPQELTKQKESNEALFENADILLVDDDRNICLILAEFLESLKVNCTWTHVPQQAAELIQQREFDAVISDIYMPGMTGHDLLSICLQFLPITPVILMTGRPTLDNTIDAIRLGAYDYLVKPFNLEVVQFTVGRALEYRRLAVENREYQQNLEVQVQERTKELSEFLFHSVQSLSLALEARDPYTRGHGSRVSKLVVKLAEELMVPEDEYQVLRLAAQLHDIGKIGVPDAILLKEGKLTPAEYDIMKDHVYTGYKILSPIPSLKEVSRYVYEHHERMDGKGYPRGLSGDEIHFNSRLIIVAEVCDALATVRSYKPAWPVEEIINYFTANSGTAYDTNVVSALCGILEREGDEILNLFNEGFFL